MTGNDTSSPNKVEAQCRGCPPTFARTDDEKRNHFPFNSLPKRIPAMKSNRPSQDSLLSSVAGVRTCAEFGKIGGKASSDSSIEISSGLKAAAAAQAPKQPQAINQPVRTRSLYTTKLLFDKGSDALHVAG